MAHESNVTPGMNNAVKALLRLLAKIGIICAAVYLLLRFVFGVFLVHTDLMYPSVRDGDLCITYRMADYGYDQIIAYHYGGTTYFGRVVALPGDVVDLDGEGNYTVNGSLPMELSLFETDAVEGSEVTFPYTVPKGGLFVLSDKRDSGKDSRLFGSIDRKDADGAVVLLLRRRSW